MAIGPAPIIIFVELHRSSPSNGLCNILQTFSLHFIWRDNSGFMEPSLETKTDN